MKLYVFVFVALACAAVILTVDLVAQSTPETPVWADVRTAPKQVIVILRKEAPQGDQIVVRTYYLANVPGLERPIMRVSEQITAYAVDTAMGVDGPEDPASIQYVHIDVIKLVGRMEWKQPAK